MVVKYLQYFEYKHLLSNLLPFPSKKFIKLENGVGILFGEKDRALQNYVDVSEYFTQVYSAYFTPWIGWTNEIRAYIMNYLKTTSDMKVIYYSKVLYRDKSTDYFSTTPSETLEVGSCCYVIVGRVK